MQSIIDFITANWLILAPVVLLIWSEVLSLNPSWKSNGVLQLIGNLIQKSQPPKL